MENPREQNREYTRIAVDKLRDTNPIINAALICFEKGQISYEEALEMAILSNNHAYSHMSKSVKRRTSNKIMVILLGIVCFITGALLPHLKEKSHV